MPIYVLPSRTGFAYGSLKAAKMLPDDYRYR